MEPGSPALGARSLSHWTPREVPHHTLFCCAHKYYTLSVVVFIHDAIFYICPYTYISFKTFWLKITILLNKMLSLNLHKIFLKVTVSLITSELSNTVLKQS